MGVGGKSAAAIVGTAMPTSETHADRARHRAMPFL
jgi:hypothetical protein